MSVFTRVVWFRSGPHSLLQVPCGGSWKYPNKPISTFVKSYRWKYIGLCCGPAQKQSGFFWLHYSHLKSSAVDRTIKMSGYSLPDTRAGAQMYFRPHGVVLRPAGMLMCIATVPETSAELQKADANFLLGIYVARRMLMVWRLDGLVPLFREAVFCLLVKRYARL